MYARVVSLVCLFVAASGCGGRSSGCPALSASMQGLAAQAASIDLEVYPSAAVCDGNDVAAGGPAPLVSRRVDGNGSTLQLPAGHYVVVLHAFDAGGAWIGSACQAELFTPGQSTCLSITLTQPLVVGDGGVPTDDFGFGGGGGGSGGGGGIGGSGGVGGSGGGDMATKQFTAQTSGVTTTLYQPWTPGNGIVYVAGAAGVILKTTDYGTTWNKLTVGTTQDIEAVWGSSASDVYAVGLGGTILHTTNAGASWTSISGGNYAYYDIWGSGPNDVYIVGDRGSVLHGSGTSFTRLTTAAGTTSVNCVWGTSASDVYLFGGAGLVMHGSASLGFTKQAAPTTDYLNYGWGSAGSADVWIPSMNSNMTSSTLWHSADHGVSFQPQLTAATPMWALWSADDGHAFLVGATISETTDRGAHWNPVFTPSGVLYGVGGDPAAHDVWSVGINGIILHR